MTSKIYGQLTIERTLTGNSTCTFKWTKTPNVKNPHNSFTFLYINPYDDEDFTFATIPALNSWESIPKSLILRDIRSICSVAPFFKSTTAITYNMAWSLKELNEYEMNANPEYFKNGGNN